MGYYRIKMKIAKTKNRYMEKLLTYFFRFGLFYIVGLTAQIHQRI